MQTTTSYTPPCAVNGCIDLNKNIADAIRERGKLYPEEHAPMHDDPNARDCALFYLHPFGNDIMGPVTAKGCGCEIRGGGNLISPLHIHHCKLHGAAALLLNALERALPIVETAAKVFHSKGLTQEWGPLHVLAGVIETTISKAKP